MATPHRSAGRVGIVLKLSVKVPQPLLLVKPEAHVLYAAIIADGVLHEGKFGSVGQATVKAVPASTVNVLLHVTGVELQSSITS